MLTILFCICIYRFAGFEKRRGWVWVGIQLCISLPAQQLFASVYLGAVFGFFMTFALMTYINIRKPVNKGPFLP